MVWSTVPYPTLKPRAGVGGKLHFPFLSERNLRSATVMHRTVLYSTENERSSGIISDNLGQYGPSAVQGCLTH